MESTWLQNVSSSVDQGKKVGAKSESRSSSDASTSRRKTRIHKLMKLLSESTDITFNTSNQTFNISRNSAGEESGTELKILQFLRDLQIYQEKVPSSYLFVLDILFPASKKRPLMTPRI